MCVAKFQTLCENQTENRRLKSFRDRNKERNWVFRRPYSVVKRKPQVVRQFSSFCSKRGWIRIDRGFRFFPPPNQTSRISPCAIKLARKRRTRRYRISPFCVNLRMRVVFDVVVDNLSIKLRRAARLGDTTRTDGNNGGRTVPAAIAYLFKRKIGDLSWFNRQPLPP